MTSQCQSRGIFNYTQDSQAFSAAIGSGKRLNREERAIIAWLAQED